MENNSPIARALETVALTLCMAAIFAGGWFAAAGILGIACMAAPIVMGILKESSYTPPPCDDPPVVIIHPPEDGKQFQQLVEASRGRKRER
jgi:hypothetical protein